ncbi:MAG: transketolase C-terminal domain-containing protein, partial [SAR324 cluster bacterium]|nr:transketolase C-terminal domain-containing protein [SAR324 cluster bacterium]
IQCEVIDPRTTSPLDLETIIESVENTGRLVVVDESNPRCSIAADISAQITEQAFESLKGPVKMVTAPHCPPPFSDVLEDLYIPSPEKIAEAVKSLN